jgi:multidrug efflux system membrane fusion protein
VQGDETAIDTGLAIGEIVVIDGADKLREGAKVELSTRDSGARSKDGARPKEGGRRKREGASASASAGGA